jgi:transcription elongation factor GreB
LQKRLDELKVVDSKPTDTGKVYFGGWVRLEDDAGMSHQYRLVGPDEFDLRSGLLSCDSPLGKALLGKAPGDTVVVNNPEGSCEWFIHSISYA